MVDVDGGAELVYWNTQNNASSACCKYGLEAFRVIKKVKQLSDRLEPIVALQRHRDYCFLINQSHWS